MVRPARNRRRIEPQQQHKATILERARSISFKMDDDSSSEVLIYNMKNDSAETMRRCDLEAAITKAGGALDDPKTVQQIEIPRNKAEVSVYLDDPSNQYALVRLSFSIRLQRKLFNRYNTLYVVSPEVLDEA